ncbi:MAG: hypothetical protein LBI44_02710 [Oscillospiraceae bacterium]|jgi:hypothetical protein|nr:hypothetical protein [Oscillospiraceae bacterium]
MKKYLTRPMCLLVSLVVLAGAVTAAAFTGSPYETLKKAAADTLFAKSVTITLRGALYVDGVPYEGEPDLYQYLQYAEGASYRSAAPGNFTFATPAYSLYNMDAGTPDGAGEKWYSLSFHNPDYSAGPYSSGLTGSIERGDMTYRFLELALDAAVGDLRHNLAVSESGGVKTVSGTFTAAQIPELYNAALNLALASSSLYTRTVTDKYDGGRHDAPGVYTYGETTLEGKAKTVRVWEETVTEVTDTAYDGSTYTYLNYDVKLLSERREEATPDDYGAWMNQPFESGKITFVSGTAAIDSDGYIASAEGVARIGTTTIFGESKEIELRVSATFENVNSTEPRCPVEGLEELFTEEYVLSFYPGYWDSDKAALFNPWSSSALLPGGGWYYFTLYFKLLPDGTVDKSSVTTSFYDDESLVLIDYID